MERGRLLRDISGYCWFVMSVVICIGGFENDRIRGSGCMSVGGCTAIASSLMEFIADHVG